MIDYFRQTVRDQLKFSFDVEQLKLSDTKSLKEELDEVYGKIRVTHANDECLHEYINKAHEGGTFLTQIAPLYDYDENIKENGYWTYVKLLVKFGKVILASSSNGTFNRAHIIDVFTILNTGLSIAYELQNQKCSVKNCELVFDNSNCEGFVRGVDLFKGNSLMATKLNLVQLLQIVYDIKPKTISLYAYFNFCWLDPSIIPTIQFFTTFLAVYSTQWKSIRLYNWLDRSNRGKMLANMGQNVHIDCLSSMWNLTEFKLFLNLTRYFSNPDVQLKNVYVERQKRWRLSIFESKVYDLQDEQEICPQNDQAKCKKDVIRCLLLRNSANYDPDNKSILLHFHGGGFISQSPESHESYLIDWAQQLRYPILSVDYSLSPEAPYPEALQEGLDTYLWLISKDKSVKDAIGFYPEKIAICGDSAGGNLTMAVTLTLNHIRNKMKMKGEEMIRMPNGIFCFYSVFFMMTIISPSRLMCSVDGLIPIGVMLNCLGAYAPKEVYSPQTESDPQEDNSITSLFPIRFIKSALYKIIKTLSSKRSVPWYKHSDVAEQFLRLNKFLSNPFMSPLLSKELNFTDVPLYLYPLTYDFLLDESIEMAKSWKGKVHLEVIDELPHGFLNLAKFCEKAKQESRRVISRVPEVLG